MSPRHLTAAAVAVIAFTALAQPAPAGAQCLRTIRADVVALDQVFFWNRLGAVQPQGMIYALRRDVVPISGSGPLLPGQVVLREGKRPRPLVLRMGVGDCLRISFQNLLDPEPQDEEQPHTRTASVHVIGLELVDDIRDDGTNVGSIAPIGGLVPPGGTRVYNYRADREGQYVFHSGGAMTGGEGDGGQINPGLFGVVTVGPPGSWWYRSQVSREDLDFATRRGEDGQLLFTESGHPRLNYDARYPPGHPRAGTFVLRMLDPQNRIIHGDLRAIVVGSDPDEPPFGRFPPGTYPKNKTLPDRDQPFREFVIVYHDEIGAVQAFPIFTDPVLAHTTHSGRDAFALNYGTGGIGAEILANRFEVGPMWDCVECKYEEFFLSSWTVGDPAEVVDVPANVPCMVTTDNPNEVRQEPGFEDAVDHLKHWAENGETPCDPEAGPKATRVFFPDDPHNVYPSYLRDHVKFRIAHGGSKEHHIHHQHTHQWLFSPDSDESTYLDSQALGPGSGFTLEMTYNGSGNRNQAVGDSIFHCHFYPHFAQGMWSMWRVHDVFERGTPLDEDGRPRPGSRAHPDGEIAAGIPIPAVVPIPGLPLAPLPERRVEIRDGQVVFPDPSETGNPGYPFFIPGIAGHRPPHPPLDFAITLDGETEIPQIDGGLPRHLIKDGEAVSMETRLDFSKVLLAADAFELPEGGTEVEKAAIEYHADREKPTCTPSNLCDGEIVPAGPRVRFIVNGLPAQQGAPYADPCIDDLGNAVGTPLFYSAADIELDVIFNKIGWHFPQQRITTLVADVIPTIDRERPPEPLFFRANTDHCITYNLTNLVPHEYQLDDFQVRTPTDILGQHIHLVKFDVTASDGAVNGWNYEDGSFSPGEVRERIEAINARGGLVGLDGVPYLLEPEPHPHWPDVEEWVGAQTTVQRWFADDVLNNEMEDRTLRTVFTHDHFGPSTHQQAGLYAGLVVEPKGSIWLNQDDGTEFGGRFDGGPTSWRADIVTPNSDESFREFVLEFADFQLAYDEDAVTFPDPENAINPPGKKEVGLPFLFARPDVCPVEGDSPGRAPLPPCPELISADDVGTMVVNYRNEPVALRVFDPATGGQADPEREGDLAFAFSSRVLRAIPELNEQPDFYPPLTPNVGDRDPFTPLLQAFENDRVQIRILVGAHEEGHNFSVNGQKWLFEISEPNSGYRNSQMMGISEHFEFELPQLLGSPDRRAVDYLWAAGASTDDLWNGLWGILRVYKGPEGLAEFDPESPEKPRTAGGSAPLKTLPSNPEGGHQLAPDERSRLDLTGVCPESSEDRHYNVVATTAARLLPPLAPCPSVDCGTLIYNKREGEDGWGPLHDPTAILYVRESDVGPDGRLLPGKPVEPLIIRARSGECITVTLRNALPAEPAPMPDRDGFATLPFLIDDFNANQIAPSRRAGLHPQLVFYDVADSDGNNVGINPLSTVDPGGTKTYTWYAGDVRVTEDGEVKLTPIEFGATGLMPADRVKQVGKGAIGALIIEPPGATWTELASTRAQAKVGAPGVATFNEYVLLFQNHVNLRCDGCGSDPLDADAVPNLAETEDAEDSGQKGFNYRTEPMWFRMGFRPDTPLEQTREQIFTNALNNVEVGGFPQTPIFTAGLGQQVRFRLVHPGGNQRNNVLAVHGHAWEIEPYRLQSTRLGESEFSMFQGAQMGIGPSSHFDALLRNGAGGKAQVPGDYLYRDVVSFHLDGGLWGLFRVGNALSTEPTESAGEPTEGAGE